MKTIKIAPDKNEITITDSSMSTKWNGGVTYEANLKETREKHGDEWLKATFQQAIGFSSKPWQLERVLNDFLHLKGKVK